MATDRELIKRSLRRDADAFAALFDRHSTAVYRYAYSLARNAEDADDLVQETFLAAWRRLGEIRLLGDSLLPWLIVACRNHASNLRRRNVVRAAVPLEDADGAVDDGTVDRLQHAEQLQWVLQAVSELGDADRRIVELCLYEGREYHEVAALLGMSIGTLTKRIHRARSRLRQQRTLRDEEARA